MMNFSVFRRRGVAPSLDTLATVPVAPERVLFLDDDPRRAEIFLEQKPQSVWVQTAADCIAQLVETWDEVHLDHDLGGEFYVDMARDDCGMEVVRWLTLEPRPALRQTRFYVHSHNPIAAATMVIQLAVAGFQAELRPFGASALPPTPEDPWRSSLPPRRSLAARLRDLFRPERRHADRPPE